MFNIDDRENRVKIFDDTMRFSKENKRLSDAVKSTIVQTKLYPADNCVEITDKGKDCEITVTKERTFQCAKRLHMENP